VAARRLIIVLLVLFAISVAAASIAPDRKGGGLFGPSGSSSSSTTTTTTAPPPPEATGSALKARIRASADRPETVEGFAGDQLDLDVVSDRTIVVEVAEFGITETAAEGAPANFDLLLRDPGRFEITDLDSGKTVGRLVVRKPKPDKPGKAGGDAKQDSAGQTT
jgi:hypothetical protein